MNRGFRRARGALALLAVIPLPAALCAQEVGVADAAATITEADYARRIGVIAHDSMFGRDTPSPGLDMTADWIASEFRRMGLEGGAADGTFLQRYPLRSLVVDRSASGLGGRGVRLAVGEDMLPLFGGSADVEVRGGLLLISGSTDPQSVLTPTVVAGKHAILVLGRDAPGIDRDLFRLVIGIRNAGAASVFISNGADDATWEANAVRALAGGWEKGWEDASPQAAPAPIYIVRNEALGRLLQGGAADLDALHARSAAAVRADPVEGVELDFVQRFRTESTTAPNAVGLLRGSDPTLADEYIVFSAHMDHEGVGTPDQNGDSIYNGADDDASGTVAVVEIAEAMAALSTAPRRSMIFLLVSGEEKGLWGSEYFADHPPVPIERVVANLNADMVGRNWTDTIVAIGREHSDLGATLDRVNAAHPELGMTAIDDLWPEQSFYTRSDHFNFARKGVPILFFFNGTHDDYHGVDDEPDKIDADKASRIAKLMFYLGIEVANGDEPPRWNPESYNRIVGGS